MRLHGFWRSIATYRVRVALNLKCIAYEEVAHDLLAGEQHDPAFLALNPMAAVPALETENRVLTQSLAILDYLDGLPGGPRFWPEDPFDRAAAMAFALDTVADAHPLFVPRVRTVLAGRFGADDVAINGWAGHWLATGLAAFEARLTLRPPAPFVMGTAPGIADIAFASHVVAASLFGVDLMGTPVAAELADRVLNMPAFAGAHPLRHQPAA